MSYQDKTVTIMATVWVPFWVRWIARDQNGETWGYEKKPYIISEDDDTSWVSDGDVVRVHTNILDGMPWRSSLARVKAA
jgi:hypothetical protein